LPADTIDLQDHNAPSAQDHSRKPQQSSQGGIGPAANSHQASELRHVQEERHNEEEHLSHSWNQSNGLSDEPPSDDERDFADGMHGEQPNHNHNLRQNGEDSEMADAESGDDMDDDMMDKISSSPSISDGGYFSHALTQWPRRSSSIRAPTPPIVEKRPRHSSSAAGDGESDASSPFVITPAHLPLSLTLTGPTGTSAFQAGNSIPQTRSNTPLELESSDSSSPFTTPPAHYPLYFPSSPPEVQSEDHHRSVEYQASPTTTRHMDEGFVDSDDFDEERRDTLGPLFSEAKARYWSRRREQEMNAEHMYQQPHLVKSASDIELEGQLLPLHDPLLNDEENYAGNSGTLHVTENAYDIDLDDEYDDTNDVGENDGDDDNAWETESENSNDSWESANNQMLDDDDPEGLLFPTDSRFIDSGWGGECLRELEDIDFEFVYALHTFVATVEGQANAQKGDTMVLLDDSNSYWWLVRVVKDSTIGERATFFNAGSGILICDRVSTG
jgi:hypothetical protein